MEKKKRITQKDIASMAGVLQSQVSSVINGDFRFVSEENKRKILDAIDATGYHSNISAQKLRLGIDEYVAHQIGLVVSSPEVFSNPFYAKIIASLHTAAHEKKCRIHYIRFFHELSDTVIFNQLIHQDEIGGLILLDLAKEIDDDKNGIIIEKIRSRMPNTVCVEWSTPLFPCVFFDKYGSGKSAVDYLFARAYTQIAYIGPADQRLSGIRDAMKKNGLNVDGMIMVPARTMENGYEIAKELFHEKKLPKSVICGSDEIATGFISFLNKQNIKIPQDIAIMGMGNSEISKFTNPPLTTMDIHLQEIGQSAVDMICAGPYQKNSVLPVEIVSRESV